MQKYGNFEFKRVSEIEELQATLYLIEHGPTGAQVMHLACDDPENLFCLSLPTLPENSNGVAHILEHTVLCGSKRFPVKDPFFSMTRRSLNTFMNAMTGSDFTCYPAASQVEQDFYNLLDVYLDAVFYPELKELSFLQEGHRFDFEEGKLIYKGIVFNEMKGGLSSPDSRLWNAVMEHLMPDLPYSFNSGGDPKVIPELSYDELKAFHKAYYHPSRCLFFFYGDLPIEKHLDFIEERALKDVEKLEPLAPLPLQKRFKTPQRKRAFYPSHETDLSKKSYVSFGWLTVPIKEQDELLALMLLDSILMDTDASPLKDKLQKSGLCTSATAYLDPDISEVPYLLVCRGTDGESADQLEEALKKALEEIVNEGFDKEMVLASLHQLEFMRTEISHDPYPFGLNLFMRSGLIKQHGCDPENGLKIHSHFKKLLKAIEDSSYLPSLVRKFLIDNTHFVRLTMEPDPKLEEKENKEERERLEKIEAELSSEAKQKIQEQAKTLQAYQEEQESQSIDCLPKVALKDVPSKTRIYELSEKTVDGLKVFHHDCFTNQILYADLVFDLSDLSSEELPYARLFTSLLPEVGVKERDYMENLAYIQAYTGGIGAQAMMHTQFEDPDLAKPSISLRGKALYRNSDKLFSLLKETLTGVRFDEKERIRELLLQIHTSLQMRLTQSAMRYATKLSLAGFSKYATASNIWSGLPYFQFIDKLVQNLDDELPKIMEKLTNLKERLFHLKTPELILSCDEQGYKLCQEQNFFGVGALPKNPFTPWKGSLVPTKVVSQGRAIASPVAFTSLAFKSVSASHQHAPALSCAMELMENLTLHKKIREQGGAYGSGANYSPMSGLISFYGFRDPHLQATVQAFHEATQEIAEGNFSNEEIEEAILGIVQELDSPVSPGSRASAEYFCLREGKTEKKRQAFRDTLLKLTKEEIKEAVQKSLLPHMDAGILVSFAGQELLEKEKDALDLEILSLSS